MHLPQGLFKRKQLIAVALIVVPWFFKDQLASSMDEKAELAQQALTEKNQQLDVQDQARDQREVLTRLREIQGSLQVVEAKVTNEQQADIDAKLEQSNLDLMSSYYEDEGKALSKSEETFEELLDKVDLDQPLKSELQQVAQQASTTADSLRAFDQSPDAKQIDVLDAALNDAHNKLAEGYDKLDDAANKERDDSARMAGIFRGIAWICTALGALLMGDWRKILGGSDGEAGAETSTETRAKATV